MGRELIAWKCMFHLPTKAACVGHAKSSKGEWSWLPPAQASFDAFVRSDRGAAYRRRFGLSISEKMSQRPVLSFLRVNVNLPMSASAAAGA